MKRLDLSALACGIVMALLLAGCGDDGGGTDDGAGAAPPPPPTSAAAPADGTTDADGPGTDAPTPKTIPESDKSTSAEKPGAEDKKKQIPETGKKPAAKTDGKKPADTKKKTDGKKPTDAKKKTGGKKSAGGKKKTDGKGAGKGTAKGGSPEAATVDSQMRDLLGLANKGEFGKSLALIKVVLARKDLANIEKQKHRAIVFFAAQIAQAQGRKLATDEDTPGAHAAFITSAKHFRHLQKDFKPLFPQESGFGGTVFYNEACALAAKDQKAAQASLTEAVGLGFKDFKLMKTDKDLEPLRKNKGFEEFIAKQEVAAAKKADAAIGKELAGHKPFPFDFTLPDLDGKPLALAKLQGKVVIVDVWGTWCPPCRAEVPHFVELQKTYGKQGLQIVGINYERGADPIPGIKSFAKEYGINYPLVIGDDATQNKIPEFQAFPTTLFIDRSGEVRLVAVGARPLEYLEAVVKKLLAEPAPAGAKKPATKKPATKKPATKKPATKKPATKKPATKKPATKKPATKKPATKKPATKKPAVKKK